MTSDGPIYFAVVSPRLADALRLTPKERWKLRYREERMRRKGYPEREINWPGRARLSTFTGICFVQEKRS